MSEDDNGHANVKELDTTGEMGINNMRMPTWILSQ